MGVIIDTDYGTQGGGKTEQERCLDLSKQLKVPVSPQQFICGHTPMSEMVCFLSFPWSRASEKVFLIHMTRPIPTKLSSSSGVKEKSAVMWLKAMVSKMSLRPEIL